MIKFNQLCTCGGEFGTGGDVGTGGEAAQELSVTSR